MIDFKFFFFQGKMNDVFTSVDTIQQYNEHFNNLRKAFLTIPSSSSLSSTYQSTSDRNISQLNSSQLITNVTNVTTVGN